MKTLDSESFNNLLGLLRKQPCHLQESISFQNKSSNLQMLPKNHFQLNFILNLKALQLNLQNHSLTKGIFKRRVK